MSADAGPLTLLLTPEEVGRRLSLSRSKVYEFILCGEIESVKIGRSRRIPVDALVSFVDRIRREEGDGGRP